MDDIYLSTSNYKGHEDEIIDILNKNREDSFTRDFLDWRYLGEKSEYPPCIFWIHNKNGDKVGMTALIFRSYVVNGENLSFAVSGDTSVNKEYRRKGLGNKLIQFVKAYLEKEECQCCYGLVNYAALDVFKAVGFKEDDSLFQYVFFLNITDKLVEKVKSRSVAKFIGNLFSWYQKMRFLSFSVPKLQLEIVKSFDISFSEFWERIHKDNLILRDRRVDILKWRYSDHPYDNYLTCKIIDSNVLIGFIIFQISRSTHNCIIYDFIASKDEYLNPAIRSFIKLILEKFNPNSIRITLNENHPYQKMFKKSGFLKRDNVGSLISFMPPHSSTIREETCSRFVTWMDKDI